MGDLSDHFSSADFTCKDCGRIAVSGELIAGLEELRQFADSPIDVLSGFRCPEHNKTVGGVGHSQHQEGTAADIRIVGKTLARQYALAQLVPAFQNGGIGIYDGGFIHVDVRSDHQARWARVAGNYTSIDNSKLLAPPAPDVDGEITT